MDNFEAKRCRIAVNVCIALLFAGLSAEAVELRGVVRDQQGAVVAGVVVQITCGPEHRHLLTNNSGGFVAAGFPSAECSVTASALPFEQAATRVSVTNNALITLTLTVPSFETGVTVTATRGECEGTFDMARSISVRSRGEIDTRSTCSFRYAIGSKSSP